MRVGDHEDLRATQIAYDVVADDYADLLADELANKPLDRGLLAAFAETVHATGLSRVADLGCGPGRITTFLDSLGLDAFGLDLSPAMISVARRTYPHLQFEVGSINELNLADDALGGIVSWYSIIHTPFDQLSAVFTEFRRVLCGGGYLLLAFQIGDECVHLDRAYGHAVSLDVYRRQPETVADLLTEHSFAVEVRVSREPQEPEKLEQAYLLARNSSKT